MSAPRMSASDLYPREKSSRSSNWSHNETKALITIWAEEDPNFAAEDALLSNKLVYAKAVKRLREIGYDRTREQIQNKLKQLKQKYRGVVTQARQLGGGQPTDWEFFEQVNQIFQTRRSQQAKMSISTPGRHANDTSGMPGTSVLAKRPSESTKQGATSSTPSTSTTAAPGGNSQSSSASSATAPAVAAPQPVVAAAPTLPEVPESDEDDVDEDEEDEGDLGESQGDDIQDLFGQNQAQDEDVDFEAEVSDNSGPKTTASAFSSFNPTSATNSSRTTKRSGTSHQNPKRPRGRPRAQAPPPRDDLTVAQAITDAVMRFIDHQSYHLTEQTKLLQRYLKFERARMRWEMDMETRRMKWEEEREMREEERRQQQEELQEKRVSDNREFMMQMAVVLGNPGAARANKNSESSKD